SPATRPLPGRADRNPASRSTPPLSRPWPKSALTSRRKFDKPWTDEVLRPADVVITMGCGDFCPIFPRQAIPRLETRLPGGPHAQPDPPHSRRDRTPRARPALTSSRSLSPTESLRRYAVTVAVTTLQDTSLDELQRQGAADQPLGRAAMACSDH